MKALSLMLIAPAGLGEEIDAAFFDGFLQADTEAGLTPWLNMLVERSRRLGSALARTTCVSAGAAAGRGAAAALPGDSPGGRQAIDIRGLLAAPQTPTKIVVGVEDRITPARHAEGLSGLIALHRFAHVGHMPHLEARREVARLIEELARARSALRLKRRAISVAFTRKFACAPRHAPLSVSLPRSRQRRSRSVGRLRASLIAPSIAASLCAAGGQHANRGGAHGLERTDITRSLIGWSTIRPSRSNTLHKQLADAAILAAAAFARPRR